MKFDLHVHTNYSDGKFKPSKMIDLAVERGLDGISITDHDSVDGMKEAIEYGRKYKNFEIIPGIELGCIYNDEEVHILGYYIDYNSKELLKATEQLRKDRIQRGIKIINKLKNLNISISINEVQNLSKEDFIGRVSIARALINKKYVSSISEAFDKYLDKDGPAYVERKTFSIKESIDLIKKAGGVPILAHPGILKEKTIIIDYCIDHGIEGIECIQSKHSKEDENNFKQIAQKNNLLITGGSDCHGEIIDGELLLGKYYVSEYEVVKLRS